MSHDKAIEHGKEHRKPWRGARAWDTRCRSHGGCKCCEAIRAYKERRRMKLDENLPEGEVTHGGDWMDTRR